MNVRAAVDAPRMHHQWMPDTVSIERAGASEELLQKLRAMGHTVNQASGPAGPRGTRTRSAWTPAARPGAPATSAAPTARRRWPA